VGLVELTFSDKRFGLELVYLSFLYSLVFINFLFSQDFLSLIYWTFASALRFLWLSRSFTSWLFKNHKMRLNFHHLRLSFDCFLQPLYHPILLNILRLILNTLFLELFSDILQSLQLSSHTFIIHSKFLKKSLNMTTFR